MSDRELDAKMAELMGVDKEEEIDLAILDPVGVTDSFRATIWANILPHYSTDIAAAWLVEERIEELGLVHQYCINLVMVTCDYEHDYHAILRMGRGLYDDQLFNIIHATPEDRCRAALMAAEAE